MRIIVALFLILFFQVDNSFYDECGNEIFIEETEKLPDQITVDFFEKNFSSSQLETKVCNQQYKFNVYVNEVKRISKNKFDVRISIFPKKEAGIEDVLKYRGYSHYILKTEKVNNQLKIKSFIYLNSEL